MSQPRLALSIGVPTGIKIFATVVAAFMIAGSVLVAVLAFGFSFFARTTVNSTIGDGEWHVDDNGNLVPGPAPDPGSSLAGGVSVIGLAGAACALLVILVAGYMVLRVWRTAAWLEGTVLTVRGALGSKTADLATSIVTGGSQLQAVGTGEARSYHRVQVLHAADPRSGVQLTLPLRGAGLAMLPAAQLTALADAITRGRPRTEATESSFVVAERLRDFARDPFA
ncbi:hypothetical protein ACFQY4_03070 [Catellatospora bangladeshensis]|uniref:Uncharacterized protein n=1 Tax=Catellatospora bangladeshensis TaxID=310355 RepID=A0A8J3NII8_9ACTN|nr:hypothetical protein [Catellatospora bangladeshensis]GIF79400.1 hypothetical protein Cba03nite_07490 [Catellatospora bangladeshensis]